MTKEVPGIRPAVISTETGTRLDEYRRFRNVVRNGYTHSFDPAKLGKLVNSAPEPFVMAKLCGEDMPAEAIERLGGEYNQQGKHGQTYSLDVKFIRGMRPEVDFDSNRADRYSPHRLL